MELKTFSSLLEGRIFQIPDYQRGYVWEQKQWKYFAEDIDAIIDDKIICNYKGTIVIYQPTCMPKENYGTKKFEVVDIVDGQQRLITCSLYLSIILNELIKNGEDEFKSEIPIYLLSGTKSKIRLHNDTADLYFDLISKGSTNVNATTVHQKRLLECYNFLKLHLRKQTEERRELGIRLGKNFVTEDGISKEIDLGIKYLKDLFDAIIRKIKFSFYPIEVENEIGLTIESMSFRRKELSPLDLLKTYLMYWVYINVDLPDQKEDLINAIIKTWEEVYVNIASCNGNEEQFLKIAWTLYHSYNPEKWCVYNDFKSNDIIPLKDFSKKSRKDTQDFISNFTSGLAGISMQYSSIISPSKASKIQDEYTWLSKIKNTGNIANYLPLIVAARKKVIEGDITDVSYINFLKAIEQFSSRVSTLSEKPGNAVLSEFYKWAYDIFSNKQKIESVTNWIMEQ